MSTPSTNLPVKVKTIGVIKATVVTMMLNPKSSSLNKKRIAAPLKQRSPFKITLMTSTMTRLRTIVKKILVVLKTMMSSQRSQESQSAVIISPS